MNGAGTQWVAILLLTVALQAGSHAQILPPLEGPNQGSYFFESYSLTGNTVVSDDVLGDILAPYLRRQLRHADLMALRDQLTLTYVSRGYVSSGATFDSESLLSDTLSVQLVEGTVSDLIIQNNQRLKPSYLSSRILPSQEEVVNLPRLEQRMQVLQQNPLILRLETQLLPGDAPGHSVLAVNVTESKPVSVQLELSNYESPSIGSRRALLGFQHKNLSGFGDELYVELRKSEGLDAYRASYSIPLTRRDLALTLGAQKSESEVVEDQFRSLNIDSSASTYSVGLQMPIFQKADSQLELSVRAEKRQSESFLLGIPFSFTAGVEDGRADINVFRFGQQWSRRKFNRAVVLRSTISHGEAIDGNFLKWQLQAQLAQRVSWLRSQIIARADFQLTNKALFGLEKFALGGHQSVRGYRENIASADNGGLFSLAWSIPVYRNGNTRSLTISPFVDIGYLRDETDNAQTDTLSSAGIGINWQPSRHVRVNLQWAERFDDSFGSGDLQDDGIHVALGVQY